MAVLLVILSPSPPPGTVDAQEGTGRLRHRLCRACKELDHPESALLRDPWTPAWIAFGSLAQAPHCRSPLTCSAAALPLVWSALTNMV